VKKLRGKLMENSETLCIFTIQNDGPVIVEFPGIALGNVVVFSPFKMMGSCNFTLHFREVSMFCHKKVSEK